MQTQPNHSGTITLTLQEYERLRKNNRSGAYREKFKAIEGEQWRSILDSKVYYISDLGRVRKVFRDLSGKTHDLILKPNVDNSFMRVRLTLVPGGQSYWHVARLVLATFEADKPELFPVYADGDVTNCKLSNLFWGTKRAVKEYKLAAGTGRPKLQPHLYKDAEGQSRTRFLLFSEKEREEMKRLYYDQGLTQTQIAKQFGTGQGYVSVILNSNN